MSDPRIESILENQIEGENLDMRCRLTRTENEPTRSAAHAAA